MWQINLHCSIKLTFSESNRLREYLSDRLYFHKFDSHIDLHECVLDVSVQASYVRIKFVCATALIYTKSSRCIEQSGSSQHM